MNAIEAHAAWAASYDSEPNPLLALEYRTAGPLLPDVRGRLSADVACGTGRWAKELKARGARTVAVDRCREMLVRAPAPAVIADAAKLPLGDACVDLAICAFAFSYTGPCLDELARITRPGGTVVVSDMHAMAVDSGWKRSFRVNDRVIAIPSIRYRVEGLRVPGLRLEEMVEACFGDPEFDLFARAGRRELFDAVRKIPAVFVAKWIRHAS